MRLDGIRSAMICSQNAPPPIFSHPHPLKCVPLFPTQGCPPASGDGLLPKTSSPELQFGPVLPTEGCGFRGGASSSPGGLPSFPAALNGSWHHCPSQGLCLLRRRPKCGGLSVAVLAPRGRTRTPGVVLFGNPP